MAGCDRSVFPGCDQSSLLATSSPSFPAATGNLFMLPPRDKKRHPTRSDRQGGNVLGCTGRSARRLGTKNTILHVLTVKAATFWAFQAVLPAASGQKTAIIRVLTVKAATFWTVLAVLPAASGQKTPFYTF